MDFKKSQAAHIVKCAQYVNLDRLLAVFLTDNTVADLRRDLMAVYFHSVNAITQDNAGVGTFANALVTLQTIIEAVDLMEEPSEKLLEIKAV